MKLISYAMASTAAALFIILRALALYPGYFAAMSALTEDLTSTVVLINMAVLCALLLGQVVVKIFLGSLRQAEIDKVLQSIWVLAIDALTLASFVASKRSMIYEATADSITITFLLAFHWINKLRVSYLFEMAEMPSTLYQIRIVSLSVLLFAVDIYLCTSELTRVFEGDVMSLIFAPHYVELFRLAANFSSRLAISLYEVHVLNAGDDDLDEREEWEHKDTVLFVCDTIAGLLSVVFELFVIYLVGVAMSTVYRVTSRSIEMFVAGKEYFAAKATRKELGSYVVTAQKEDLDRDNVCVICREDMTLNETKERLVPKRMVCGHVIHLGCLKSWIGRSQNCPTCRQPFQTARSAFSRNAVAGSNGTAGNNNANILANGVGDARGIVGNAPDIGVQNPADVQTVPARPAGTPNVASEATMRAPGASTTWQRYAVRGTAEAGREVQLGEQWYKIQVE